MVLVLIKGLGIGGAERLIVDASEKWDRTRFDYRVAYLLPWKNQLVGELELRNVPVTLLGRRGRLGPMTTAALRRFIRGIGAALVHAHLPASGILARLASPVPVIYTEHNLVSSYRQPTRLLNRLTYARNARTIAVSQAVAESASGYPGRRPIVIPNGISCAVSPEETAAVRAELGIAPERPLVVHVGNIRPHKGHGTLLQTAVRLRKRLPGVLVVSIGGEKYPGDLHRLETEAAALGVADTIRLLGRKQDARPYLAAADVVINPSDVEGLPLVLLEAMALARPIVATAVGGVPGVIEDGVTGLLVPARDPDALADQALRLLTDSSLCRRLGGHAREHVERCHGIEPMVRAVETVYEEILVA